MDARIAYRQLGNPRLVMWEKPKSIDAVHQPAISLLQDRESIFCKSPRNNNSSGHAVKKNIPAEVKNRDGQACHLGANARKCISIPSGMAIQPNTRKLPRT